MATASKYRRMIQMGKSPPVTTTSRPPRSNAVHGELDRTGCTRNLCRGSSGSYETPDISFKNESELEPGTSAIGIQQVVFARGIPIHPSGIRIIGCYICKVQGEEDLWERFCRDSLFSQITRGNLPACVNVKYLATEMIEGEG